jgi:hypothetical protein
MNTEEKYALVNEKGEVIERYRSKATAENRRIYFKKMYGNLKLIELKELELKNDSSTN